jgi:hypothetical protein
MNDKFFIAVYTNEVKIMLTGLSSKVSFTIKGELVGR